MGSPTMSDQNPFFLIARPHVVQLGSARSSYYQVLVNGGYVPRDLVTIELKRNHGVQLEITDSFEAQH